MNHKITIITVTYNAEKYLEQTLKSVIEQDYSNIEYIIIDGGSTDNTIDIIKKYIKYISYWCSTPDNGIYDAMNKGINIASGEWINFMNAGDSFTNNSIISSIFTPYIVEEDYSILYGAVNIIDEILNTNHIIHAKPMSSIWEGSYCNHQSMFVKTSIMKKHKFNINYKLAAEKKLFIELYLANYSYKILNFPISNFIITNESFSFKHKIIDSIEMLYILSQHLDNPMKIFLHDHYQRLKHYEPTNNQSKMQLSKDISNLYFKACNISKKYKNILLYGNGTLSKMISHIFQENNLVIVDKNKTMEDKNIFSLDIIKDLKFDIILITVLGREEEISSMLQLDYGIDKEKIIYL